MSKTRKPPSPVPERDPERENVVRVAALVAADGRSVPESVLNDIVVKATRPGMSMAQSVNEATSAIQQIVNATTPVNFSAPPQPGQPGAHHHHGNGTARQRQSALTMDDDGDRGARTGGADNSSLRFGEMKLTQAERDAQAIAHRTPGLEWAAHQPDLLRLGPAAMETFAKMKFERESYLALSRDAGASAKEIHAFVHAAKEAKVKPEELGDLSKKFGATSQGLSPEEQRRRMEQMTEWMRLLGTDPAKAAAKLEEMRKEREELVKRRPDKAKAASDEAEAQQEIQKRIEMERQTTIRENATHRKADELASEADALLAAPAQKAQTPILTVPTAVPGQPTPGPAMVQPATPPDASKQGSTSIAPPAAAVPVPSAAKPASPS